MELKLSRRVANLKPSATLAVDAKAKAMKAMGIDVIGFGAGEPDFDTPNNIKEAAIRALKDGFTKYCPVGGTDDLKEAIIEKLKRDNGVEYKKSEIIVSCGAKHSLYNFAQAFLDEGDEVIIPSPYWVSYPEIVSLAGGVPVIVKTEEKNGFKMLPEDFKGAITSKTKAVILNSPCNPTGSAYTRDELERIASIALEKNVFIVSDEIYEKLVYDGFKHVSIASLGKEIKDITLVVNGVSKAYSMTGWRIGYAAGSERLIKAMTDIQSQSTSNPTSFAMKASVEALRGRQDTVATMVEEFSKRRDYMVRRLNSIKGIRCFNPAGAFYVFPNVSYYYGKSFNGRVINGSSDFAEYLLEHARVAVVPGIAFGADENIRLSYATSMETIREGIDRIEDALRKLI